MFSCPLPSVETEFCALRRFLRCCSELLASTCQVTASEKQFSSHLLHGSSTRWRCADSAFCKFLHQRPVRFSNSHRSPNLVNFCVLAVTPSDPYVFQGQKLQLCCNVSHAVKNPPNGEVVFERWNTTVAVVTPSSAGTACIEPDTSQRTPGAMFYCSYPGYRGYQMVIIDGPEPTLSRPECTLQDMALTCQVKDIRSTLLRPENVTYRLYLTPARSGDECTAVVCRDGYCTCSLNRAHLNETYSLNLTVTYKPRQRKTMVWVNVSSLTPINVVKVVPSSFSVTPLTNACLNVSWSFDNYDEDKDKSKEDLLQQLI
ncbi:hypothetical protein C0Q70_17119 [Pomacea canaliculata]|uniref:Uncharacterized protein n=1 Tax=Pomacea canaliculata TaxID=400727 RepID=A0A2T7NRN8_POMCA|nr:hypothetical protein C0Q70_17119 [Pomacea canaliculata]